MTACTCSRKKGPCLLFRLYLLSLLSVFKKPPQLVSKTLNSAAQITFLFLLVLQVSPNFFTSRHRGNRGGLGEKLVRDGTGWREEGGREEGGRGKEKERETGGRVWSSGLFSTEACDTGPLNKCSVCCSALQWN